MYILTFSSLSNLWGQLSEHLCLFWTFAAAERSAPTLDLTCSPLLTPRGSPLPSSPELACQDTPLPILLLPKPRSTVSSKGKTQSIQSVHSLSSLGRQTPAPNPPIVTSAAEVKQNSTWLFLPQYTAYLYSVLCNMLWLPIWTGLVVWNSLVFNMPGWITHLYTTWRSLTSLMILEAFINGNLEFKGAELWPEHCCLKFSD